jgi:hypothetical protein
MYKKVFYTNQTSKDDNPFHYLNDQDYYISSGATVLIMLQNTLLNIPRFADYQRKELVIILKNCSSKHFIIRKKTRLIQLFFKDGMSVHYVHAYRDNLN